MLITNAIRVKMKKKELPLLLDWLEKNPTYKDKELHKTFTKLADDLVESIEHFEGLAELDRRMAGRTNRPMIVRLNHVDEHLEDVIAKYEFSERLQPGQAPLRREFIQAYKEVLAEMQKK